MYVPQEIEFIIKSILLYMRILSCKNLTEGNFHQKIHELLWKTFIALNFYKRFLIK